MASTISAGTTTTTALVYSADTSGVLQLQTNGTTTAVTIDTNQNVGVGVTPSAWGVGTGGHALEFSNAGSMWNYSSTSGINLSQNVYYNGAYYYKSTAAATLYGQGSGSHIWYNAPSGTGGTTFTPTQAMTLDVSGNLLVGRSSSLGTGNVPNLEVGAGMWHAMSNAATVNNAGTLAVFSGSNRFCGFLTVVSIYSANATQRTQTTYSAFIVDGDNTSIQQINTATGTGGGSAFTLAWTNGTGFVVTNTSGAQRTLYISATGTFQG